MGSLTINQKTNYNGFPKAAELIEITGAHQLEASDRALQNMLLQVAHDSGRMTEPDAEWPELTNGPFLSHKRSRPEWGGLVFEVEQGVMPFC